MRKSRFTEEQIIAVLHEGAAGASVRECAVVMGSPRRPTTAGSQYGGLQVSAVKQLKALVDEHRRLKRIVADQAGNLQMIKDVLG